VKGLFTVLCRACGWTSPTDRGKPTGRLKSGETFARKCPKCGSADLQIGPKS